MSDQTTYADILNAISSRASADGRMQLDWLDGLTSGHCGPEAAPVNRSVSPGSRRASKTTVISGPSSPDLSASASLQSSLENRLRARLTGSDLCEVIWKPWATPWGQSLSKPRARVRTISGIDTGSWPTPRATDGGHSGPNQRDSRGNYALAGMAHHSVATWPSPSAQISGDTPETHEARQVRVVEKHGRRMGTPLTVHAQVAAKTLEASPWPTPTSLSPAKNGNNEAGNSAGLVAIRKHAMGMYPTPRANKWGPPDSHGNTMAWNGSSEPMEKPGALNPAFVCWLMGYPDEWVSCGASATQSTRAQPPK